MGFGLWVIIFLGVGDSGSFLLGFEVLDWSFLRV